MRIGVFDSGLGGLTVLRELRRKIPWASYVYLWDTARTPYGSKSEETIARYAIECASFLLERKIDLIVVACNSVSAVALRALEDYCTIPVIGTVLPAVRACEDIAPEAVIGVIGTRATIGSGIYERCLLEQNSRREIISVACPLFVPFVEEGIFSGRIVQQVIEMYLEEMHRRSPRALILGCTHYPLLAPALADFFGGELRIIECSRAVAEEAARVVGDRDRSPHDGQVHYYATDEVARFNRLASLLLDGAPIEAVKVSSL